jgi:amphiphysin
MGTSIMQKTGQVERTIDREFAEEEGRYRTSVMIHSAVEEC